MGLFGNKVIKKLKKEADKGNVEAQVQVGEVYIKGKALINSEWEKVKVDEEKGIYYLTLAANQRSAKAMELLSRTYFDTSSHKSLLNPEKAEYWGQKFVENAPEEKYFRFNTDCLSLYYKLGWRFKYGQDRFRQDDKKAFYWYSKGAEFESWYRSQFEVAQYYYNGKGGVRDLEKACYYLKKALNSDQFDQKEYSEAEAMYVQWQAQLKAQKKAQQQSSGGKASVVLKVLDDVVAGAKHRMSCGDVYYKYSLSEAEKRLIDMLENGKIFDVSTSLTQSFEKVRGAALNCYTYERLLETDIHEDSLSRLLNGYIAKSKDGYNALSKKEFESLGVVFPFWKVCAAENGSATAARELYGKQSDLEKYQHYQEMAGANDGRKLLLPVDKLPGDERLATYWTARSIALGNKFAFNDLGEYYECGVGVEPNLILAQECYQNSNNDEKAGVLGELIQAEYAYFGEITEQHISVPNRFENNELSFRYGLLWEASKAIETYRLRLDLLFMEQLENLLPKQCRTFDAEHNASYCNYWQKDRSSKIDGFKDLKVISNSRKEFAIDSLGKIYRDVKEVLIQAKNNVYCDKTYEYQKMNELIEVQKEVAKELGVTVNNWKDAYHLCYAAGLYSHKSSTEIIKYAKEMGQAKSLQYKYQPAPVILKLLNGHTEDSTYAFNKAIEKMENPNLRDQTLCLEYLIYHTYYHYGVNNFNDWKIGARCNTANLIKLASTYRFSSDGVNRKAAFSNIINLAETILYKEYQRGDKAMLVELYEMNYWLDESRSIYWAKKACRENDPKIAHALLQDVMYCTGWFSSQQIEGYIKALRQSQTLTPKQHGLLYSLIHDSAMVRRENTLKVQQAMAAREARERVIEEMLDESESGWNALLNNDHLPMTELELYMTGKTDTDRYLKSLDERELRRERIEKQMK